MTRAIVLDGEPPQAPEAADDAWFLAQPVGPLRMEVFAAGGRTLLAQPVGRSGDAYRFAVRADAPLILTHWRVAQALADGRTVEFTGDLTVQLRTGDAAHLDFTPGVGEQAYKDVP